MIAVIADDLSGAAELANAALELGFSADVQRRFDSRSTADVVCVTTDSRSLAPDDAASLVRESARRVRDVHPALVFKKCDSLLRGTVAAEAHAMARVFGCTDIMLAAANPSRGRTVRGGVYMVDGVPLADTVFAKDPEHPRLSSRVEDLLGDSVGIEYPDIISTEDIMRMAHSLTSSTLAVGAIDFFGALLSMQPKPAHAAVRNAPSHVGATLFVCGSLAAWLARGSAAYTDHGVPSVPMPRELHERNPTDSALADWVAEALAQLRASQTVLLAVGRYDDAANAPPAVLSERLARAVANVLEQVAVARVFIEGGSTATAIASRLGMECFHAERSPGAGVGALRPVKAASPQLLVKPGSYPWPDAVWTLGR